MNILFISNGSAEDSIAVSLIRQWLRFKDDDRVAALPMVGLAKDYIKNDIPIIAPPFKLPSNGFAYQSPLLLYKDLTGGLIPHLMRQYKALKELRTQIDYVVGVGDIVPILATKVINKPNAFVGCAMSDYYLPANSSQVSSYSGIKRDLIKKMNTIVFPRDVLTTNNLIRLGIKAEYHGNPMMDSIEYSKTLKLDIHKNARIIGILPGSHDDARDNFRHIMSIVQRMAFSKPLTFLVSVSDRENVSRFGKDLGKLNWFIQKTEPKHEVWRNNKDEIHLLNGYFGNVLLTSHVVIGLSGTGNEQAAGIGIPIISFPAGKIQYTKKFGIAQKKLLGKSLTFLGGPNPSPELLLKFVNRGLNDDNYRKAVRELAVERFGEFGASERIVYRILQTIHNT